jgi:MarR family transcriptional regulator, 2-MHQ and catechol-resistance regulon repressor
MAHRFLRTIRLLVECYQTFERTSGRHVRTLGLTPPQFDIVATLGNTPGMTFKELGEATLITKGTLTGIIDRLEAQGVVARQPSPTDGRSTLVKLTRSGDALFRKVFPAHVEHIQVFMSVHGERDLEAIDAALRRLRDSLAAKPSVPGRGSAKATRPRRSA